MNQHKITSKMYSAAYYVIFMAKNVLS